MSNHKSGRETAASVRRRKQKTVNGTVRAKAKAAPTATATATAHSFWLRGRFARALVILLLKLLRFVVIIVVVVGFFGCFSILLWKNNGNCKRRWSAT